MLQKTRRLYDNGFILRQQCSIAFLLRPDTPLVLNTMTEASRTHRQRIRCDLPRNLAANPAMLLTVNSDGFHLGVRRKNNIVGGCNRCRALFMIETQLWLRENCSANIWSALCAGGSASVGLWRSRHISAPMIARPIQLVG